MGNYRDGLQIIADILKITEEGVGKTEIMFRGNLSYTLLENYTKKLLGNGMLIVDENHKYRRTSEGEEYIEKYEEYKKDSERVQEELRKLKKEKKDLELFLVPLPTV